MKELEDSDEEFELENENSYKRIILSKHGSKKKK